MKNSRIDRILSYLLVALLSVTVTVAVMLGVFNAGQKGRSKLDVLEQLILECYIEDADKTKMEDAAANAMVHSLGDRWSYYIPASDFQAYQEQMRNAYVGVGITIEMEENNQGICVLEVAEGGPAQEAGIQPQDVIVKVNETSILGMTSEEAKKLIQGQANTTVVLTALRDGQEVTFNVTRREIITPVAKAQLLEGEIGLISIANFNSNCATQTIAAIQDMQAKGAKMLIFDVRNNPGGYAEEMIKVLDYLLPEGKLFTQLDYTGKEHTTMSDANCVNLPMVVLVNAQSFSAAEFFGAALSEYDAATVVGEKTVGKGYFQNTFQLPDGSAVGLSVGKYYTPKGNSLEKVGITPDVQIALSEEEAQLLYAGKLEVTKDPQILAAIQLFNN